MAKTAGLGDDLFVAGYHIGGDIQQVAMHGGPNLLDVTDITQSAHSRLGGLRDGAFDITSYLDPAAGAAHAAFSPLPTADVIMTYLRGQALGNPALCQTSKQVGYDPTRAADGSITLKVAGMANGFGQEWGIQLTAGARTDTTATTGAFYADTGQTAFGCQAYLQIVSFSGTSVDVTITQATTSGGSYSTLIDFGAQTGIGAFRQVTSNVTTVDQFLKVATAGTFSSAVFQVTFVRNKTAGQVF
jgi:hypothetical protein